MKSALNRSLILIGSVILLISNSLIILHSIVPNLAIYQLIFAALGLLIVLGISRIDNSIIQLPPLFWYGVTIIPLVLTEIFGVVSRGSARWIAVAGYQFQTSELAKITLILFVANWIHHHPFVNLAAVLRYVGLALIPTILIFIQPDLGSSLLIISVVVTGLLISHIAPKYLLLLVSCGLALIPISLMVLKPYQKERITSFISPQRDPTGSGYNAVQATIAVGSGQISGRGLGQGTQSHLKFLPERQTDFIFASFVEEMGFAGGLTIILVYIVLSICLVQIAHAASNQISATVALLSASLFMVQATINIGMNMGILPITGVTLPLFSYGGSSLISMLILIGINLAINRKTKVVEHPLELR